MLNRACTNPTYDFKASTLYNFKKQFLVLYGTKLFIFCTLQINTLLFNYMYNVIISVLKFASSVYSKHPFSLQNNCLNSYLFFIFSPLFLLLPNSCVVLFIYILCSFPHFPTQQYFSCMHSTAALYRKSQTTLDYRLDSKIRTKTTLYRMNLINSSS